MELQEKRNLTVLVPKDAGVAVVQGAVVFGRQPGNITSRILKYTYGTQVLDTFIPGVLDPDLLENINGKDHCTKLFGKFIDMGTSVEAGKKVSKTYTTAVPNTSSVNIAVFTADEKNPDPMYTNEKGCRPLPPLTVTIPQSQELREIVVDYMFGVTELHLKAMDKLTQKPCEARLKLME